MRAGARKRGDGGARRRAQRTQSRRARPAEGRRPRGRRRGGRARGAALHRAGASPRQAEDMANPQGPPEAWLRAMVASEPYDLEALCALRPASTPSGCSARLSQLELAGWIRARRGRPIREGRRERAKVAGNSSESGSFMAKPLVIVESPAKAKTLARFLGDAVPHRGQLRTCAGPAGEGVRGAGRRSASCRGAAWAWMWTAISSRITSFRPTRRNRCQALKARAEGRLGAVPGDRPRPRRRVHQLAPARDPQAEGAGPPHRVPRDHRGSRQGSAGDRRTTSTRTWSRRRRAAASWTGSTGTRCRRCCGRRWPRG